MGKLAEVLFYGFISFITFQAGINNIRLAKQGVKASFDGVSTILKAIIFLVSFLIAGYWAVKLLIDWLTKG